MDCAYANEFSTHTGFIMEIAVCALLVGVGEGRGVFWLDGYLGFEPRVTQLCRLEAFALWGEVTLSEVLCSWWERQAMPHLLIVSWHLL